MYALHIYRLCCAYCIKERKGGRRDGGRRTEEGKKEEEELHACAFAFSWEPTANVGDIVMKAKLTWQLSWLLGCLSSCSMAQRRFATRINSVLGLAAQTNAA